MHDLVKSRAPMASVQMDDSLSAMIVDAGRKASVTAERIWGTNTVGRNPGEPAKVAGEGIRDVPILMSGAGHDAAVMTRLSPRVGMIWVRCKGGISHAPEEFVDERDIVEAATTFFQLLQDMVGTVVDTHHSAAPPSGAQGLINSTIF